LVELRGITLALPDSYYAMFNSELNGVTLVLPDSYYIHV